LYEPKPGALSAHGTSPPLIPIQALICGGLKKHGEAGIWLENQASELPLGSSPRESCGVAFDVRALAVDLVLSWILSGNSNAGGAIGSGPSPIPRLRILRWRVSQARGFALHCLR
jgi:hypothetical protein